KPNANHNGLGEMAAFLSVFSKKMTVCPIPIAGFGYVIIIVHFQLDYVKHHVSM
ncbi:MAG: hypothetical protein ACI9T7_003396, partial [Oleiphilaceae bacterium]